MPRRNAPALSEGAIFSGAAFVRFSTWFLSKGDLILLAWQPFVLREAEERFHSFLMEGGFATDIGSRHRYRAMFFAGASSASALQNEGGAGRRGFADPHGPCAKSGKHMEL